MVQTLMISTTLVEVYLLITETFIFGEVCLGVLYSIVIIPEVGGHRWKWLCTHQLSTFIIHWLSWGQAPMIFHFYRSNLLILTVLIPALDSHGKVPSLDLPSMDG